MDKRGSAHRIMLEIGYIVFAVFIGLSVLYISVQMSRDTTFQAKLYAEDIMMTIDTMQAMYAHSIKVNYNLPEKFDFEMDSNKISVNDENVKIKLFYFNKPKSKISFERKGDTLILKKNEA